MRDEQQAIGARGPTILHVGPSGWGVDVAALAGDALIRPPIRRGDPATLLKEFEGSPGTLLVVDGTYFDFPAVGHMELRELMAAGWSVWGVSSMGAARAYEMRAMGMRGFGRVYEELFRHEDFQDDEIALLHSTEAPFIPLTEPLIHIREALWLLARQGRINPLTAHGVIEKIKAMWFGHRSLAKLRTTLAQEPGGVALSAKELEAVVESCRVKKRDLEEFLTKKPWLGPKPLGQNGGLPGESAERKATE